MNWLDIEGWLTPEEGAVLRQYATGKKVLELGSYCGRSTVCMAEVAELVVSVDHHQGDEWTRQASGKKHQLTHTRFRGNIVGLPVLPLWGRIEELQDVLPADFFDLVFVDSGHGVGDVQRDLRVAIETRKGNGIILLHDWNFPEVKEGVGLLTVETILPTMGLIRA